MLLSPWGEDSIPLPDIREETESARAIWISTAGFVRVSGDDRYRVDRPVATAVTDRRLLVLTQGETRGQPDEAHPISYSDIAAIDVESNTLVVTTTDSTHWRVPFPDETDMEPILRHLRWIGDIRAHVLSIGNDVELAAGEIADHAYGLDWQAARETYQKARQKLDQLITAVQIVDPVAEHHLAPDLTEIEREIERAHARIYIERSKSALELVEHLVDNGEYDRASGKIEEAHQHYREAKELSDATKRGDAFQFGPQRELEDDLEDLNWEIETVAAEPLREAHDEKMEAGFATDAAEKLERWERAYELYGNVKTMVWEESSEEIKTNVTEARKERETAAERIVELRQEHAREAWDTGATHQHDGNDAFALKHCKEALAHLERVCEVLEIFEVTDRTQIEQRVEHMRQVVEQLRNKSIESKEDSTGETQDDRQTARSREPAEGGSEDESGSLGDEQIPSVSELSQIDTHHEIALELPDPSENDEESQTNSETDEEETDEERATEISDGLLEE